MALTKCYFCLCQVCNALKCPFANTRFDCCYKSCHVKGERIPRLECDFFIHYLKTKCYRVKRRSKRHAIENKPNSDMVSQKDVSKLLEKLLSLCNEEIQAENIEDEVGIYELYYGNLKIKEFSKYSDAKIASKNYANKSDVKIIKI